jgi:hypothetical protein
MENLMPPEGNVVSTFAFLLENGMKEKTYFIESGI